MNQSLCRPDPRAAARWWVTGMALLAALAAPAWGQDSYSYLRTVEGYAELETADGEVLEAMENHPLVPGDQLRLGSGSRVEVILSDGTVLRIDERTDLALDQLAWTPDSSDTATRLTLLAGELQAVVGYGAAAGSPLTVETRNATLYLEAPGEYRVSFDGYGATQVVVRDGTAESQTDRGSAIVRAGETAYIEGGEWATIDVARAGSRDRLESWGDQLDAEARLAHVPHVEPELRYRAARMASHGAWLEVGGRPAWRPHVGAGWRPYTTGSWVYTPSGLTWVSTEPWGWIPSHYGSWELVAGHGWVWFAGAAYSPAWVYWYWGPTHVAWVPSGYYTGFYGGYRGHVPRHGVYGWAGGGWDHFGEWVFCPTRYFGRPHYERYFRSGHEVGRHATYRDLPRGVIATDTRSLRRDVWGQPEAAQARLTAARSRLTTGTELPDVTDFVARRREMRPEVAEITRPQAAATRSARARVTSAPRASVAPRGDRGEITLGSRLPLATRTERDLRVFDRARPGMPQAGSSERRAPALGSRDVESNRLDLPRSVLERRTRSSDGASSFAGARSAAPPPSEERPIVQRVIEQVRSGRTSPVGSSEATGASSARPQPSRPESAGSASSRVRSAPADRSSRTTTSSDSRSRGGSSGAATRQRAASARKPPDG